MKSVKTKCKKSGGGVNPFSRLCISAILCVCGCLSLSQCEKASSCLRLGVITTRQQHVNKEDDWSACAFVFHANQPADAAALCFVQLKQTEQHHCQHHAHSWHLSSNQYYCFLFICLCSSAKGGAGTGRLLPGTTNRTQGSLLDQKVY